MMTQKMRMMLVDYHIKSRFTRLTTHEGYDFAFVVKGVSPETAMWRYDSLLHRHNIIMNISLDERIETTSKPSNFLRSSFIRRVYDHEGGHSLFTSRNNPRLLKLAKHHKIPLHIWNFMEDARIETCWRARFTRFHWSKYVISIDEEKKGEYPSPQNAIRLFLDCIRMENSYRQTKVWVSADKDPKIAYEGKGDPKFGRRSLVAWYYKRAIRARSTEALIPIIESWLKTFPETAKGDGAGESWVGGTMIGVGGGMPKEAMDADGSEHKEISTTVAIAGTGAGPSAKEPPKAPEKIKYTDDPESKKIEIPRNRFFSKEDARRLNYKRCDALIRLFERFLEGGEGLITSRSPSGKIDMRRLLRGADDIYLRKGDDPSGVKEISFILDASGSMTSTVEPGLILAYILNELVKKGKIRCKSMILSGGDNYALKMPFDNRLLNKVQTPGGIEGFANTMRVHERDLIASDMTIFFTDGDITDEHIHKEDWHRKGVYTIGLFVGPPERSHTLHKWFDSVLVRNSIEAIADSLVQLIKRV